MYQNDVIAERIKLTRHARYKKLCAEAQAKIDLEALGKELVEEAVKSLQSFKFYFNCHDSLTHTHIEVYSIANSIVERVTNEVFDPIDKFVVSEMEDYLDLLYSRPSADDIKKILDYINEGGFECSA